MKDYIVKDPWKIIEDTFKQEYHKVTESLCSIGNGMIGHRGNFEEYYSGETLQGNYIAGIYYPDKTRVGWWKNGYPEYFAKVLNSANWIGIDVWFGDIRLDLNHAEILSYKRELDMQSGILSRQVHLAIHHIECKISTERFCSYVDKEIGWSKYSIESVNYSGPITLESFVDFNVRNQDANYDENFWDFHCQHIDVEWGHVFCKTKKTDFKVCAGFKSKVEIDDQISADKCCSSSERKVGHIYSIDINGGQLVTLTKCAAIISEFHHGDVRLTDLCREKLDQATQEGYPNAKEKHKKAWLDKWIQSDIKIEGDISAQQGIRFNIFHLNQTYTGTDSRLNIGPKGFTGEKYGGSTYWDTEAYCLPFYLSTATSSVAKNLLIYRYNHLQKAIENAAKLGFSDGAALYPMVTINGEECHNEWEITFEEIHRNGAIAYAIYDYVNHTGDMSYLHDYGLDVLVAICRFWKQRVNWSNHKEQYVILGVTGPNEYENNVNNNWYTNYIASWCLRYTMDCLSNLKGNAEDVYDELIGKLKISPDELEKWTHIIANMYYPYDENEQIYLQQEGFLDKEIIPVTEIPKAENPINQHWSWDRILRSCFIKQADVLQGFYFFEDDFTDEELSRHFDFYEPITVHESSLSPCVHSILACRLGNIDKAYEMYLRTARLDVDDYNNDTEDGLHITSMAGTWMTITKGFAGMRVKEGLVTFDPTCPENWSGYSFSIQHAGQLISITIKSELIILKNHDENAVRIKLKEDIFELNGLESKTIVLTR